MDQKGINTNSDSIPQIIPELQQTQPKIRKIKAYDKKVHGKRYLATQKIAIKAMKTMVDKGEMTVTDVARSAGTSRQQVYRVWDDPELTELSKEVVDKTKRGLSGLFYKRALQATFGINEDKIKQASALQLATVAGIMTEKGRLMEGLSTDNISHRGFVDNLEENRKRLMDKLEKSDSLENE